MNRWIGLDPHSETCMFVVQDEKGSVKIKMPVETNGQALIEFVKTIPGQRHLCIEEGTLSQWLYEILSPHVYEVAVVPARKNRGNKNDFLDAYELANRMRLGDLGNRIYKPGPGLTTLKYLVRSYEMITGDLARAKNRINYLFRSQGAVVQDRGCPGCLPGKPGVCLRTGLHAAIERLRKEQEGVEVLKLEAHKEMVLEAQRHPIHRILRTAPGIGPVRAAELMAIVVSPHRFRTHRQLWKYSGLAVVQRSSSDWVRQPSGQFARAQVIQTRGLNRDFNHHAKAIFKGAAMTVITSMPQDPLRADYDRLLANGTKPNLARLTLARKICAIVHSMWKNQEVYDPAKHRLKPD
ncbi:MAG: transposase [bacterium]